MTFTEKINALMTLTGITNSALAKAMNVDRSTISRMKTGSRGKPKPYVLRQISDHLAAYCQDDYKLSALYELTDDVRLRLPVTQTNLSDILFNYLMTEEQPTDSPIGRFLHNFKYISKYDENTNDTVINSEYRTESQDSNQQDNIEKQDYDFKAYYGNEGKRQAVLLFINAALALNKPCIIQLFTDEVSQWMIEDASFSRELAWGLRQLATNGYKFQRIKPPSYSLEYTFHSIELWLPIYMANAVEEYYYPWMRDDLHRKTLFVIPEHFALYSSSLNGQKESRMTIITKDIPTVAIYNEYYNDILKRCKPLMQIYTAATADNLFEHLIEITRLESDCICKTGTLSAFTLPSQIIERIRTSNLPHAQHTADNYYKHQDSQKQMLKQCTLLDIIYLRPIKEVLQEQIPIPIISVLHQKEIYYTAEEYILHLRKTIYYMDRFPNYQVYISDNPISNDITIYSKNTHNTILIKESAPFILLDIIEHNTAVALHDYLRHIAFEHMRPGSRAATRKRLQEELYQIEKMTLSIKQNTVYDKEHILKGKHILIAEDQMLNIQIIRKLLEKKGIKVTEALNGQIAVDTFFKSALHTYDIVLMDIHMPNMNGLTAAKAIRAMDRADAPSIPIVAMTADAFVDDIHKFFGAGMNAYLVKPISPQILYSTLCQVLLEI